MNYRRAVQKAQAYRRRSVRWGGVLLPGDVLRDKHGAAITHRTRAGGRLPLRALCSNRVYGGTSQ